MYGSFPACLVEASWGIDGQEMAQAALHRQNNGMSRQEKCWSSIPGNSGDAREHAQPCWASKAPSVRGSLWWRHLPFPAVCFGQEGASAESIPLCPTEGCSLLPSWLVLMSLVCAGNSAHFLHVKVRGGECLLRNHAMVSVPCSYNNVLILVK